MSALTTPPVADAAASAPLALHNLYHRSCVGAAQEAALFASLAGLALLKERAAVPHGQWLPWVAANCAFSPRTAQNYIGNAERALVKLYGEDAPDRVDFNFVDFKRAEEEIAGLLADDHLAEQRAALIAAIRPPKPTPPPAQIEAPKPAKPRAPRPAGPRPLSIKAAPQILARIHIAPREVKTAIFTDLRPEFEAWLAEQSAA